MSEQTTEKRKDPDNVFLTDGKRDTSKIYAWVPWNYFHAKDAIREAGGVFKGDNFEFDKARFEAEGIEAKIRAGARTDIGLGQEGRKAEHEARTAAKEKERADRRQNNDATRSERLKEADKTRMMVVVGAAAIGQSLQVNGQTVQISELSKAWEAKADQVADYKERFGVDIAPGQMVAYAKFAAPEAAKAMEVAATPEPETPIDAEMSAIQDLDEAMSGP